MERGGDWDCCFCLSEAEGMRHLIADLSWPDVHFEEIGIDHPQARLNSVLLIHRPGQQKLEDSVIRSQPRTLVAADTVFRSGREAGRSGAFPRFVTPTCRLHLVASARSYSCFAVNRCDKGFQ